jgi:ornithine carbamoyltransferase
VLHSWVNAAELFECELTIAVPDEYWPEKDLMQDIKKAGSWVKLIEDPREAVQGADLVITDTWVSMGDTDAAERRRVLKPYRVDPNLMAQADKNALFMHCLPAHRGDEVTDEVIDGPQSVVWDEAENRLHAQKAILCWALGVETN